MYTKLRHAQCGPMLKVRACVYGQPYRATALKMKMFDTARHSLQTACFATGAKGWLGSWRNRLLSLTKRLRSHTLHGIRKVPDNIFRIKIVRSGVCIYGWTSKTSKAILRRHLEFDI